MGSHRIILTAVPNEVEIDAGSAPVCVYHKAYAPPDIPGARYVEFKAFAAAPRHHLQDSDGLVWVGLSRSISPSNRTQPVWETVFNLSRGLPKWSIDRVAFVGEPWRLWFHFGLVGATYREYTYSYLAESHWRAWRDGRRESDPFSVEEVARWGGGVIRSDGGHVVTLDIQTVETTPEVKVRYAALKAQAFEEERTPTAIIRRLATFAKAAVPSRKIPARHRIDGHHSVVATDLRVDTYLVGELRGIADHINQTSEAFK